MNVDIINLALNCGCAGLLTYICLKLLIDALKFRHH